MKIDIQITPNPYEHINQIITGFYMLFGDDVELHTSEVVSSRSHILVQYNGIRILYDLDDGYFTDAIKKDMTLCDYYFKRSYNTSLNKETGLDILGSKCLPLGFNYDVSLPGKFYGTDYGKLKNCLYRMMRVNKPESFEECPSYYPESGKPVILFFTRLWAGDENYGINKMRIGIIRALKEKYGKAFKGGEFDSVESCVSAVDYLVDNPDKIMDMQKANREYYLHYLKPDVLVARTLELCKIKRKPV